jgi:hypothetical protein
MFALGEREQRLAEFIAPGCRRSRAASNLTAAVK